jgi:hypothetical protein
VILAACGGHRAVVEWLVDAHQCSLWDRTTEGDTALLLACYCGHLAMVEWILTRGGQLATRNSSGLTPLLSAANGGRADVVRLLLSRGCSIDETDHEGFTPLLLAACRDHLETFLLLLLHGASLSARSASGMDCFSLLPGSQIAAWIPFVHHASPLHVAALLRERTTVASLLRAGAHPRDTALTPVGALTPLQLASVQLDLPSARPVDLPTVSLLAQAARPWCPCSHFLFGPATRSRVFSALLLFHRLRSMDTLPQLPEEIVLLIISFLGRSPEPTLSRTAIPLPDAPRAPSVETDWFASLSIGTDDTHNDMVFV